MRLKGKRFGAAYQPIDPLEEAKRRAHALADSGQVEEAVEYLSNRLQRFPRRTDLLLALGRILLKADRLAEAIDVLLVLEAHMPENGEVAKMLGHVYGQSRQYTKSIAKLNRAHELMPEDADILISLAQSCEKIDLQDLALDAIQKAVLLKPDDPWLRCSASALLHHDGRGREASQMLLDDPVISQLPEIRLLEAMLFPVIPESFDEILERRRHYRETMLDLAERAHSFNQPERSILQTNFLLGYHGLEDRELIELFAKTILKLCPELEYTTPKLHRPALDGRRIKVGFVSANMRNHSVGRVLNRFLKELDRSRFEVTLFELPGKFNGGQEMARELADRTVFVPADLSGARRAIENEEQDVLMFPDFVLDPAHDRLAFSRLAPVQCSTWGHPGTSGRPSIDYWVSCEDWEPEGNERLYTEKLIRFKSPPMIASRLDPPDPMASREELGLPEGTLYGCPQSIYKLHPEFDDVLAAVLRRDPKSHVVVIGGVQSHWHRQFKARFAARFEDVANRVVMLRHLDTRCYLSLLKHCAVSLDPTHFGGANTSMEAFSMGLPVVTWPRDQLRNRQTLSFYRMMQFEELIVDSAEAYVELAFKLAHDQTYRDRVSSLIHERCNVIFDTVEVTRELEEFFETSVRKALESGC
jgi:predicted O-linked N-acetylglucosamine transferase (SPINDLY family)